MSEYWKSTPKYWCKHCETYVRDTKLEKQNHEATPKHQGNLRRFLRDLHRGNEKVQKDKERAKQEVARLNGLVSGVPSTGSSSSSGFGRGPRLSVPKQPQVTTSQRKQQLAQLAELGVSVPDEFRGDLAMAGEWQVTSERIIDPAAESQKKPEAIGFGVRKRAVPEEEEESEAAEGKIRRWGSAYRTQLGDDDDADLEALLSKPPSDRKAFSKKSNIKEEFEEDFTDNIKSAIKRKATGEEQLQKPIIKGESSDGEVKLPEPNVKPEDVDAKLETNFAPENVVFKKRKAKPIRQK